MFGVRTFFSFELSMDFVVDYMSSWTSTDVLFSSMLYNLLCWFDQQLVQWVSKYCGVIVLAVLSCAISTSTTFERILVLYDILQNHIIISQKIIMQSIGIHFTTIRKEIWNRSLIVCFTCRALHKSFWHTDCPKFTNSNNTILPRYTNLIHHQFHVIYLESYFCTSSHIISTFHHIYFFTTLIWMVFHRHSQFSIFYHKQFGVTNWTIWFGILFFDLVIWCHKNTSATMVSVKYSKSARLEND